MEFNVVDQMMIIKVNAIMTLAMAAVLLLIGYFIKDRVGFLTKYCIPAPVVGGFLFMFVTYMGHISGSFSFQFDGYFQNPFMLAFFTCIGLGASFSLLKKGGILLVVYWLIAGIISIFQNAVGVGMGSILGLDAPYALLSSAISMIGGHGAALSYGGTFTDMGYEQGRLIGAAAATFGLLSAVIIGGPLGNRLIVKNNLKPDSDELASEMSSDVMNVNKGSGEKLSSLDIMKNITVILVCMSVGSIISGWVGSLIGMGFPSYVGAMFVAVVIRNANEAFKFYRFDYPLVDHVGEVTLSLYLSMAFMTLKLWELAGLITSVVIVVMCQVLLIAFLAYFVVFRILGKNYDAAVMCAGLCGHGLGATPSAIVNMTAVTERHGMSHRAFMVVPIVGSFLVDIIYQPQTIWFIKTFVKGFTG